MLAALVLSSSCKPKATSRQTLDRTWGFIINSKRRERRTCAERGKKPLSCLSGPLPTLEFVLYVSSVCTCEPMSSLRNKRIASLSNPTTALSTRKQLSLAWTHNWYRWSRTVCQTHDTLSLQTHSHLSIKIYKLPYLHLTLWLVILNDVMHVLMSAVPVFKNNT